MQECNSAQSLCSTNRKGEREKERAKERKKQSKSESARERVREGAKKTKEAMDLTRPTR